MPRRKRRAHVRRRGPSWRCRSSRRRGVASSAVRSCPTTAWPSRSSKTGARPCSTVAWRRSTSRRSPRSRPSRQCCARSTAVTRESSPPSAPGSRCAAGRWSCRAVPRQSRCGSVWWARARARRPSSSRGCWRCSRGAGRFSTTRWRASIRSGSGLLSGCGNRRARSARRRCGLWPPSSTGRPRGGEARAPPSPGPMPTRHASSARSASRPTATWPPRPGGPSGWRCSWGNPR